MYDYVITIRLVDGENFWVYADRYKIGGTTGIKYFYFYYGVKIISLIPVSLVSKIERMENDNFIVEYIDSSLK